MGNFNCQFCEADVQPNRQPRAVRVPERKAQEVELKSLVEALQRVEGDQKAQDDLFYSLRSRGACMIVTVEIEEPDSVRMLTILKYLRALLAMQIWSAEASSDLAGGKVRLVKADGNRFFIFALDPLLALKAAWTMKLLLADFHTWIGKVCPEIGPLQKPVAMKACIDDGSLLLLKGDCFGHPMYRASKLEEDIANFGEIIMSNFEYEHADFCSENQIQMSPRIETEISGVTLEYTVLEVKNPDSVMPAVPNLPVNMPSAQQVDAYLVGSGGSGSMRTSELVILTMHMSGFMRLANAYGILHFFRLVCKARDVVLQEMEKVGGFRVKCEGDNIIAAFPSADAALVCIKACMQEFRQYNKSRDKDFQVRIGFGLDIGEVKILGHDIVGTAYDRSFKLAGDVAEAGEVLITERVKAAPRPSTQNSSNLSNSKLLEGTEDKYYVMSFQ